MKDRKLEKVISSIEKEFGAWLRVVYYYIVDTRGKANFDWNDIAGITALAYNSYLTQNEEVKDTVEFLKNYLDNFFLDFRKQEKGGGEEMKESKKSMWWKSLSVEEQQDPKNVKKLWHRGYFRRRREDKELANVIAYAQKQLSDFNEHISSLRNLIDEADKLGVFDSLKKRIIGYLFSIDETNTEEPQEVLAEQTKEEDKL